MKITAQFDVTGWNPEPPYDAPEEGPALTRIGIEKVFRGALDGESVGVGLFCGTSDPSAGAGYLVSERVTGVLDGRRGTFVMHHGGLMGPGVPPNTFGSIVPGSGTGELTGLSGTVEISRSEEGEHVLILDCDVVAEAAE